MTIVDTTHKNEKKEKEKKKRGGWGGEPYKS